MEKRKVEGIIFDWAGTTVDYGSFAPVQAFVEVFRHFGIEPTVEEVRKPMGMLKIDHIRTMLNMERIKNCWEEKYGRVPCDEDAKELYGHFEEKLFGILNQFADPKPQVVEVTKALREKGIVIGSTTGYTGKMMEIVTPLAKEKGYAPDAMVTPDDVGGMGRPYPYMIFKNMELLKLQDVRKVIKVGDTISDIKEGKNAGVITIGVVVGSSQMGLTQEEYEALSPEEAQKKCEKVKQEFLEAGADGVITNMEELLELI
ncbi:MAG: phosphonoacetaldehyde hydrolase [Ruminococcus sp.]|jgi:phosphonoacetaldehyde hydrolase